MRRTSLRLVVVALLLATLVDNFGIAAAAAGPALQQPPPPPAGFVPAPVLGPKATVAVNPSHGYAGQQVQVSGSVPSSAYPAVRIAWAIGDTTYGAAVANRTAGLTYSARVSVPLAEAGADAQVCVALTGSQSAAFTCVPFTIDAAPPGAVTGALPADAIPAGGVSGAQVHLLDRAGNELYSGPIQSDGTFDIDGVAPGTYRQAVTGRLDAAIAPGLVSVNPGVTSPMPLGLPDIGFDPVTGELCSASDAQVTSVSTSESIADFSIRLPFTRPEALNRITYPGYDFGIYLQGVSLVVPFHASVMTTGAATIDRVDYDARSPSKSIVHLGSSSNGATGYRLDYDIGNLPSDGTWKLIVAPVVGGVRQCPTTYTIRILADPMKDPMVQPGGATTWNATARRYEFHGILPNAGGLLPMIYPNPPPSLPLIGKAENKLSAGVTIEGHMGLNGVAHIDLLDAGVLVRLISQDVYNKSEKLLSSGGDRVAVDLNDPAGSYIRFGPKSLYSFNLETTVFNGVVTSFWGIVTVNASISVGLGGQLTLSGTIYPFEPALDATLQPSVSPSLTLSIWVDILLGVASAGADARATAGLGIPLRVDTRESTPVWVDTPCVRLGVKIDAWARVNLLLYKKKWNIGDWTLFDYSSPAGCSTTTALQAATTVPVPRVIAAPSVAAGLDGRMLSVYVEDTTPGQATPTMRVMARFWNPQTQGWGTPVPLSAGTHAVQDPVATFAGPDSTPIVAWTETVLTLAEDDALGDDLDGILARQEVFSSYWNGQAWSTPARVTTDLVPDGRAALAGDVFGATLAWVRNTGLATAPAMDSRIEVADWKLQTKTWGPGTLLTGNQSQPGTGMNVQVSAARSSIPGQAEVRALAWTWDGDGKADSNADRRVVVARWQPGNVWAFDSTGDLPAGADSPSLSVDSQTGLLHLAFLVRGKDADGKTDTGIGNQAQLWTGVSDGNGTWSASPVMDGQTPVRAERPRLTIGSSGERLLLFRRFGAQGTNGALGQLSLAQAGPGTLIYSRPAYLTDETRQHWQQDVAINPVTNAALVVNVSRAAVPAAQAAQLAATLRPAVAGAAMRPAALALTATDDPVEALSVSADADLALDPELELSERHAPAGTPVTAIAHLRNLGRGAASSARVCFYERTPPDETQIGCVDAQGALAFNDTQPLSIEIAATGGEQPIYARIQPGDFNGDPDNDTATGALGALPAPVLTAAGPDGFYADGLDVSWLPPDVSGIAGFRILRGAASDGPYDLAGETGGTTYPDLLLERGKTYCYVVQAYDSAGTVSPNSNAVCAALPELSAYLPLLSKR